MASAAANFIADTFFRFSNGDRFCVTPIRINLSGSTAADNLENWQLWIACLVCWGNPIPPDSESKDGGKLTHAAAAGNVGAAVVVVTIL
ncbi:MAG: hypothetical protein ACI9BW_002578 [Gammaproteobacteria bacterium]|jgi:hypothetical protein